MALTIVARLPGMLVVLLLALAGAPAIAGSTGDGGDGDGEILLTIEFEPVRGRAPPPRRLSLCDLRAYPPVHVHTSTIWTSGPQRFTGLRLHDLLRDHAVTRGRIALHALNDYRIFIPVSEIAPDGAVIAYERNGGPLSRRGKGPLWVIYDYDSDPRLRSETVYSRSIWQLDRIVVSR